MKQSPNLINCSLHKQIKIPLFSFQYTVYFLNCLHKLAYLLKCNRQILSTGETNRMAISHKFTPRFKAARDGLKSTQLTRDKHKHKHKSRAHNSQETNTNTNQEHTTLKRQTQTQTQIKSTQLSSAHSSQETRGYKHKSTLIFADSMRHIQLQQRCVCSMFCCCGNDICLSIWKR